MRKLCYTLLFLFCSPLFTQANPGDTTWVAVQNNLQLTRYGAYDTSVSFPAGNAAYRKVYLVFTLGTYSCPVGAQYCHQWDYDVHNILMTPTGDTIELSRFITPYANTGVPRFPSNWTYRYIFDVTDYYPLLKGNAALRIFYSGYSFGFTANVRFAFVEGTPERNVIGIKKLWGGGFNYGVPNNPIDSHIKAVSLIAPAGTKYAELKMNITGHGYDANQCCEFASHNYYVKLYGSTIATQAIWRADCGYNELYPQGGTWVYERANWCPGAIANPFSHKLPGIRGGDYFTTDIDFDSYTNTNTSYGSYNIQGNLIYYSGYNKTRDASLESIIAPSDFEGNYRENPSNGQPILTVRNSGSDTIRSIQFTYGVPDSAASVYLWQGSLLPSAETQIQLPELSALKKLSMQGATGTYAFSARIASVNGASDDDPKNDTMRSAFTVAPTWPGIFTVYMITNSDAQNGVSETSWKITDAAGNVVASRSGAAPSTVYNDTVAIAQPGMYKLTVTDIGCDGMNWWAGTQGGHIAVRDWETGITFPLHGNINAGTYHDDFGCGFSQSFSTAGTPAAVSNIARNGSGHMIAYPNPAKNMVKVELYGLRKADGEISISDAAGKRILSAHTTGNSNQIDVTTLAPGIYNITYRSETGMSTSARLTIVK
jgi:hypothetical protein